MLDGEETLFDDEMLESIARIARSAGEEVMAVYASDFEVRGKQDSSPVTQADLRAERVIVQALSVLTPEIPVIAEEAVAAGRVPASWRPEGPFWLVDPLDGTKEFVSRNGEFTVNIALIEGGEAVLGVVLAPATGVGGRMFAGRVGGKAWVRDAEGCRSLRCRMTPTDGATVVASRSHGDAKALEAFLAGRRVASLTSAGSSLKLCLIAEGKADLYPRLGRTMEWDIAAGHAVLAAAGGHVDDLSGQPLRYGKAGFENPHFVAAGQDRFRAVLPAC